MCANDSMAGQRARHLQLGILLNLRSSTDKSLGAESESAGRVSGRVSRKVSSSRDRKGTSDLEGCSGIQDSVDGVVM